MTDAYARIQIVPASHGSCILQARQLGLPDIEADGSVF